MRQDAWRAYLEMALGVTEASRKRTIKVAKKLVGKSELTAEQLQGLADELIRASNANREALANIVRVELDRALGAVGLAKADEVETLAARVRELEAQLRAGGPAAGPVDATVVASTEAAARSARQEREQARTAVAADSAEPASVPASLASPPVQKTAKKAVAKKAVAKKAAIGKPVAAAVPAKKGTAKKATRRPTTNGEPAS